MKDSFSKRNGFHSTQESEISIREDAPEELRGYLVQLAYECGFKPSGLRAILCKALKNSLTRTTGANFPTLTGR